MVKRIVVILTVALFFLAPFLVMARGGTEPAQDKPAEPRVKLTMLHENSGAKFPEGSTINDNPFADIIRKLSNVDLEIVEFGADFQTRFNLMLASGEIYDIVQASLVTEVEKNGKAGAFLALNEYIEKSPVISELYSEEAIELMTTDDGNIYGLRTLSPPNYSATLARIDLIDELNDGQVPHTPDEWFVLMKKEKAKYPDSVPRTGRGGLSQLAVFFKAYGVNLTWKGADWQFTNGKFIHSFEARKMKDAILFYKRMYDEGILPRTFVTDKTQEWVTALYDKGMLLYSTTIISMPVLKVQWLDKGKKAPLMGVVPTPMEPGVDHFNVLNPKGVAGPFVIAVASTCKDPEAAIRVIETLLSPELELACSWGREGIEFVVSDKGGKLLVPEADKATYYRYGYLYMHTFWPAMAIEKRVAEVSARLDADALVKFKEVWRNGLATAKKEFDSSRTDPANKVKLSTELQNKQQEAYTLTKTIILKAIVGDISMDEYEAQVKDFLIKYASITDEYNRQYAAVQ